MKGHITMDYLSVLEMSKLWEITPQQIRTLCREGRVPGAIQTKDGWMIPKDEQKPGRKVRKKAARGPNLPKNSLTPFAKRIVYQKSKEKLRKLGVFQSFGGYKRDRTADLLNAIT